MLHLIAALLLLAVGFMLGVYVSPVETVPVNGSFVFTREINVAVIVSILMPMLVGLLVTLYFQRPNEKRLLIRQIIVDQIKLIDSNLEGWVEIARANQLPHTQAASLSKKCTLAINSIFDELMDQEIGIDKSVLQQFQLDFHRLRSPFTDIPARDTSATDRAGTPKPELEVIDGICIYSLHRIEQIDSKVAAIRRRLLKLTLDVHNDS